MPDTSADMTGLPEAGQSDAPLAWYEDAERWHITREYHSHGEFTRDAALARPYGWVISKQHKSHPHTLHLPHLHRRTEIVVEYARAEERGS